MAKQHRFGSKEWYKAEIRKMVVDVNQRFYKAKSEGKMTKQLKDEENRLIKYGSKSSIIGKNRGETIGLGFHKKPSKEFLQRQYQELKRILKKDIWTPKGKQEDEEREDNAYKTFRDMHPNWSKEKWRDFVQLLGTAPAELLQAFGYEKQGSHSGSKKARVETKYNESFVEAYSYAYDNDVDLFRVMENTYREISGYGYDQTKAIDALKENIKHEISEAEEFARMYGGKR